MNLIAVDIGNTNIGVGLFLKGEEAGVESVAGGDEGKLAKAIEEAWEKIPVMEFSKEGKRDGVVVVCSVKPEWTKLVKKQVKDLLGEKVYEVGKEIPFPMDLSVDPKCKIGPDRVLSATAAYAVVEAGVVIADIGTAMTIDLVDDRGIFLGGVICPGFEISAKALKDNTALLPMVEVTKPTEAWGKTTEEAINCGLYYSAVGTLEEVIRRFAEKIGYWPQTVVTGAGAKTIKDDCKFIDSFVPNLVMKGIALAYQKYAEEKE
jgi:type III pantothenate kinase